VLVLANGFTEAKIKLGVVSMTLWQIYPGYVTLNDERQNDLYRHSPYRAVNTLHLGYKNQSVNVV
jgi:hypothetical protein